LQHPHKKSTIANVTTNNGRFFSFSYTTSHTGRLLDHSSNTG
jgi:hypothetical protein